MYVPTMGIISHGPPLYAMQAGIGLHSFRGLVVDYIAAPSQRYHVRAAQLDQQLRDRRRFYAIWAPTGALRGCM
jgi:hypothetical protein